MPTPQPDHPISTQELANYATVGQSIADAVPVPAGTFQFFAAFDGTWNDRSNIPLAGTNQPTNVAQLETLVSQRNASDVISGYYRGVGTSGVVSQYIGGSIGPQSEITAKAEQAFSDLTRQANQWARDNPDQSIDVSVSMASFSRGAGSALAFANLLNERGIPDTSSPKHTVEFIDYSGDMAVVRTETRYERNLFEPGQVPITSNLMYDPVLAGISDSV